MGLVVGDFGHIFIDTLKDQDWLPLNLTGWTKIELIMELAGIIKTTEEVTVLNLTEGVVQYVVKEGDLHSPGVLKRRYRITFLKDGIIKKFTSSPAIRERVEKS